MEAAAIARIETNVDRAASVLFAGACAFASYVWFGGGLAPPVLTATAAAAALAYLCSARALGSVQPRAARLAVPVFDVREIDSLHPPELLLTAVYERAEPIDDEPLLLDDILSELGPDSRVIRLFDPAAMPTPGQLSARIDEHLDGERPQSADAVQALHDALAELRRSLR
jgi:hypothetical protein